MTFLVTERDDVHAGVAGRRVVAQRARGFERIDDTERTVEPAGMVLALDMGAGQNFPPPSTAEADDIADAVDLRVEPGLGHAIDQPLARHHVFG